MIQGEHTTFQYGATNLVASVARQKFCQGTQNSDTRIIVQSNHQVGHQTVQVSIDHNVYHCTIGT